jgi:hypothetical protein
LAPAKEEKLFENQFHYYDLTLKLVSALIGLLGVLIGALSLLAGLGGYIFYRDRKTMRDEIAANAKAEVDISSKEFQSKLKDQMHALESLVDQ